MPVLYGLQQSVDEYYINTHKLPDLEKIPVTTEYVFVDTHEKAWRINLSLLNKDLTGKYLQLQPYLEQENVAWECVFVGDLYRDDIPDLRDGICHSSRTALERRSLIERVWNFMKRIWGFILGYLFFIALTFLFGQILRVQDLVIWNAGVLSRHSTGRSVDYDGCCEHLPVTVRLNKLS